MGIELDITTILILIAFGFLAAFIDAVVGGGGLISLPALMFAGLPPTTAIATNKLASVMGAFSSTLTFYRSGQLDLRTNAKLFPLTFFGAIFGAWIVHLLDPELLKPMMLIMLTAVLIYTLLNKDWGSIRTVKQLSLGKLILFLAVILLIGFYDGFLGPGTGSFLIFAFLIIGYDFLSAAGNAKLLNFGSNVGALLMFISLGHIHYTFGIIMGLSQVAGAIVGSKFAIRQGSGYVRILFIIVTVTLLTKSAFDLFR